MKCHCTSMNKCNKLIKFNVGKSNTTTTTNITITVTLTKCTNKKCFNFSNTKSKCNITNVTNP